MVPVKNYNEKWIPSVFEDFFDNAWMARAKATAPAINVMEDQDKYHIELAVPGMNKDDFKVYVDDNANLVINMEHKSENTEEENKNVRYLRREFNYSKFQQTLILPEDVDKKGIAAKVKHGVLHVTLPKLTPEQKQEMLQTVTVE